MTPPFIEGPISRVVDGIRPHLNTPVHATEYPPCTGGHQNDVNVDIRGFRVSTNFGHSCRRTVEMQDS